MMRSLREQIVCYSDGSWFIIMRLVKLGGYIVLCYPAVPIHEAFHVSPSPPSSDNWLQSPKLLATDRGDAIAPTSDSESSPESVIKGATNAVLISSST